MKDLLEIHEFFVEGSDHERSHVLLHITEPGTAEERAKGYFFALVEINNGSLEQIERLQQMIDDLESGYYESDDQQDKNAFEVALEFINRRGHHILQYKNSLINFLVGVLRDHELFLSYHGSPQAWLFYQENNELKNMDILAEQGKELNNEQLFSSLLQGNLNDGDYFYLATPHVSDYFITDRVKKIIAGRNTRQSASHIQKVLKELNADVSFGGMLFHHPDKKELSASGQKPINKEDAGSVASLNKLIGQERSTEEILASPMSGMLKKKWHIFRANWQEKQKKKKLERLQTKRKKEIDSKKHGAIETNFRPRDDKPHESLLNIFLVTMGRILVNSLLAFFHFLKKTAIFTGRGSIALILLISNKDNKRQEVVKQLKRYGLAKQEKWLNLPLLNKIILSITIILGIIFIGSILTFKIKENLQANKQAYLNQVQAVLDKKTAADAGILYGDEAKSLTLLQEAKESINNLPNGGKAEKEKKTELANEVEAVLMKLRKLENVKPEIVADLAVKNPQAQSEQIMAIDNILLAYGQNDKYLYKIDPITKQMDAKEHSNVFHLQTASTPKEQDTTIFVAGPDKIAAYNKDTSTISAKDIAFPRANVQLATLFVYNRRLYTLDPNNNQIYKHNPTQTGYDKGADWLKDANIDVKDGISLAIDGDVFVLKKNGEILKLVNGVKVDFNISGIDPKIENPNVLWTYNNVKNIYILESANKRVVALNKTGKLIKQYTAAEWQNPTGMVVDEAKKIVYILDSNKIYKFGL